MKNVGIEPEPVYDKPLISVHGSDKNKPELRDFNQSIKPPIEQIKWDYVDNRCNTNKHIRVLDETKKLSTDATDVCGTVIMVRTYRATDGCDQHKDITQHFKITPSDISWKFTPEDRSFDLSDDDLCDDDPQYVPKAVHSCNFPLDISFQDEDMIAVDNGCGGWKFVRRWTAEFELNCKPFQPKKTIIHEQNFDINPLDPAFSALLPETAIVPFFDNNIESLPNVPVVDAATPGCGFDAKGIAALRDTKITLQSVDTALSISGGFAQGDGSQCQEEGLASFDRTWTAQDSCENTVVFNQRVVLSHPPLVLNSASPEFTEASYTRAVDVNQINSACKPSKNITMGKKMFDELINPEIRHNCCFGPSEMDGCVGPWKMDGCRKNEAASEDAQTQQIMARKPTFASFPPTAQVTTAQSPLPQNTGVAIGVGFCQAPVTVDYEDVSPVEVSCGVWHIERIWTVRNDYLDCKVKGSKVTHPDLIAQRTQLIIVQDIAPPVFLPEYLPEEDTEVGLFTDYGPSITGVPKIEDIADDPTCAELGLVSYNITLDFEDVSVNFKPKSEESCIDGLVVVTRRWNATDRCGNADQWFQTVRISHPRAEGKDGYFSTASGFQVFAGKYGDIKNTHMGGALAVGGEKLHFKAIDVPSVSGAPGI